MDKIRKDGFKVKIGVIVLLLVGLTAVNGFGILVKSRQFFCVAGIMWSLALLKKVRSRIGFVDALVQTGTAAGVIATLLQLIYYWVRFHDLSIRLVAISMVSLLYALVFSCIVEFFCRN